ncbi:hypothetical protein Purlil1_12453 [Purpureocillium lilacinum]|uniref:Uncharacterized protein n=1 Tax=Purpureocillium lilacinum TaxID=33203 RepID=A0ABR0BGV2_PURLI|nr:hypothetical protein Purlil1_12453 [Purpureocillium lilacinum]
MSTLNREKIVFPLKFPHSPGFTSPRGAADAEISEVCQSMTKTVGQASERGSCQPVQLGHPCTWPSVERMHGCSQPARILRYIICREHAPGAASVSTCSWPRPASRPEDAEASNLHRNVISAWWKEAKAGGPARTPPAPTSANVTLWALILPQRRALLCAARDVG